MIIIRLVASPHDKGLFSLEISLSMITLGCGIDTDLRVPTRKTYHIVYILL